MLVRQSSFGNLERAMEQMLRPSAAPSVGMDAYRRDTDVWVHVDLPGVEPASIEAAVDGDVLTISAERTSPGRAGDTVFLAERRSGSFVRKVRLGDGLDAGAIEADYHLGVLTLRIPVAEAEEPRRIDIQTGGALQALSSIEPVAGVEAGDDETATDPSAGAAEPPADA